MKQLTLTPLPYGYDALEPVISKQIMELHHDKHHAAYVNAANTAIEKLNQYRKGDIELNVREVLRDLSFNYNGAMLHDIFWSNMRPKNDNNQAGGTVLDQIIKSFGSEVALKKEFSAAATTVEGSGWAVLWKDLDGDLTVGQVEKHNLLGLNGLTPILVLDVWEHAYYLQYLNNRASYVDEWWKIVNWDDVERRFIKS